MRTNKQKAFTIAELLTTIAIIAILVGILMPAMAMVKKMAKDTKQKAQISSIDVGINLYKNDRGEYPPSHGCTFNAGACDSANPDYGYCGAQTLAEAMFGQDLLGFHPDSIYRADGQDASSNKLYDFTGLSDNEIKKNLDKRKGPYIQRENIGVFTPRQIYSSGAMPSGLQVDHFLICDVFTLAGGGTASVKVGTPVLYFRANPSAQNTELDPSLAGAPYNIYNYLDNTYLVVCGRVKDGKLHELETGGKPDLFYNFIKDSIILNLRRPVRPDSFLLISAGEDGFYGTADDICNFEPNLPG
jgi:prepilin-type N-terminal cleavage/methylation domain-containing protein